MADFEHKLLKRWAWTTFVKSGLLLMAIGAGPILLYSLFGPADGNPVGLGMLMVVLVPVGFLLFGTGLLKLLLAWLLQHRD
ncbi:MAG: hypothetical protein ABIR05_05585 [Luteimonas sp.]